MFSYGKKILPFKIGAYAPVLTPRIDVLISARLGVAVTTLIFLVAATEIQNHLRNSSVADRNVSDDVLVESGYIALSGFV